jgi:hypothetical protein
MVGSRQYLWEDADQERGCSEQKTLFVGISRLFGRVKDTFGDILQLSPGFASGITFGDSYIAEL